ncbi:MAG: ABC transporter substrate-binding protein, partial [Chloroflexi bacterium]|nr:ABC transporter substrate-binding protein [Chloroflexota bacterium]
MRVTWAKAASLLLVVVLVASVAGLAGCGGEQTTEKTLVIGFLDDLTGPAGFSVSHTLSSTQDYLKMAEEENQFPGLKVKLINYDTRLDYSRTVPGYVWLKGQGTQLLFMLTSTFVAQVRSSLERDNIPCFASGAIPSTLGSDWIYSYFPAQNYQSEAIVQWIIENWDYTTKGRAPKIGMISQFGYEAGPLVDDWVNTVLKPRYP